MCCQLFEGALVVSVSGASSVACPSDYQRANDVFVCLRISNIVEFPKRQLFASPQLKPTSNQRLTGTDFSFPSHVKHRKFDYGRSDTDWQHCNYIY